MRSKTLQRMLVVLLSAALTIPLFSAAVPAVSAASAELSAAAENTENASWSISTEKTDVFLPRDVKLSFAEAAERYQGGKIEPLAYYACGVVSGCNYYLICRETAADGTVSLKKAKIYDPNFVNSSQRTGKARFTSVEDFNLEDCNYNYTYPLPDAETVGGMFIPSLSTCDLPEEVQTVYDSIFENINGGSCDPLAYLGKQTTESGTDYAVLCCRYAVVPMPDRYIDVVMLHEDTDGSTYVKSTFSIFGQRTNFPKEFKNKCSVEKNTITLGESVKINLAAQGGTGDYKYTVSYRKMNTGKWIVKKADSNQDFITFKPAAATTYEVEIYVDDGENERGLYSYIWVDEKLNNTSTISAETIRKGQSVTLKGTSAGGTGSKTYAVYYKKKSSDKWTAVQKYKSNSTVKVTPKAATDYDVCIKVKDEKGTISKKYFTVSVTK